MVERGTSRPFPQRLGRWMVWASWLLLLALLTLVFQSLLEREQNPNRDLAWVASGPGPTEVVLQRNRAGHYVASGTINSHAVVFLVDTGATDVALAEPLARRIGLEFGQTGLSRTAGGLVRIWSTRLDRVRLGGIEQRDVRAVILPGDPGTDVLLGMSFLKRLELIQSGDTLTLRQPAG